MRQLTFCASLVVLCLCAAGCTPQDKVVKLYDDLPDTAKSYDRLLVVSISSDANLRKAFEEEVVRQLQRSRVEAFASHDDLEYSNGVSAQAVGALSKARNTDGFLLLQVVSADTNIEVSEGKTEIVSTCRGGDPFDYFLYDYTILQEPDMVRVSHTVVVVSSLYDSVTKDRIWSIKSTCFKKSSLTDALQKEAELIVTQLHADDLI